MLGSTRSEGKRVAIEQAPDVPATPAAAASEVRAPIRVLPPGVAARIAAGEVIERPASVVKELVENALDAGARTVEVAIVAGGIERIRVRDDGSGIPAGELADAFERHATSKLRSEHDLFAIRTLGFRGEALAAIAAAADVDFVTRPAGEGAAAVARSRDGQIERLGSAGAAPGTSVEVRALFAALPARRRFLRAPAAEARAVAQVLEAYALAYPAVAFRLTVDERRVLTTDGAINGGGGDARAAFAAVHGEPLAATLLPVSGERTQDDASARVTGLVGPPHAHRANRRALHLFANGRAISARALVYAVEQAYAGRLPGGRYPVGILHITVPPDQIDVNVHPTKAEVRFRHERLVYGAVAAAVHAALDAAGAPAGPSFTPTADGSFAGGPFLDAGRVATIDHPDHGEDAWSGAAWPGWAAGRAVVAGAQLGGHHAAFLDRMGTNAGTADAQQTGIGLHAQLPALRALGQLDATYLVAEAADGLVLIDQHAAHERVLYEQVCAARTNGTVPVQPLLAAVLAPLSAGQAAVAMEHAEALAALGFTLEPTDGAAVLLRAVPAALAVPRAGKAVGDPARLLAEYLDRLAGEDDRRPGPERAAATLACRAAVMAGDRMDIEQQRGLLRALEQCESPQTCPHGRPTTLHLATSTLARSFGRR